jgi:hypothetical protein
VVRGTYLPVLRQKFGYTKLCHSPLIQNSAFISMKTKSVDDIIFSPPHVTKPSLTTRVMIGMVHMAGGAFILTDYVLRTWLAILG